jgi:hypothetical protein
MKILVSLLAAVALLATGGVWYASASPGHNSDGEHSLQEHGATAKRYAFRAEMRRLWEDHIVWTRQVIVGLVAGTPDTNAALTRLLRNQSDIGDAIKPFYGDAAGDKLTALLRDHILIAGRLLTAAKASDTAGFTAAKTEWYANADEIAVFLAGANPRWSAGELKAMMKTHLDTTLDEGIARLTGNWDADVVAYDKVHAHILHMSDVLSDGIIAQFHFKFAD